MKWMQSLLLVAAVAGCAPSGDGDVVSCSCEISYIDQDNQVVYEEGTMPISLCETSFATDHSADAETECVTLTNAADTSDLPHQCACSCIHLVQRCDTQ